GGEPRGLGADAARAAGDQERHPLSAPPVRPCTRYRRTTKEKTSTGSMIMVPPAAMRPHSQPSEFMKFTTATGAVIASVRVRIRAKKKSFQANRKQRMAVAARPGPESGRMMR